MNFEGNKGPTLDSAQSLRLIGETITMTTLLELLGHALGALTRLVLCVKSWKRDLSLTMCRPLSACCVVSQLWALVLVNEGKNTKKTKITKHTDPNHIMWEYWPSRVLPIHWWLVHTPAIPGILSVDFYRRPTAYHNFADFVWCSWNGTLVWKAKVGETSVAEAAISARLQFMNNF